MCPSITDINFIKRLGLSALSLLTLWLGPTLPTLADGTPVPGDHTVPVCIPPPERDCLKDGRGSREKVESATAVVPERNAAELMEIGKPGPESEQWVTIGISRDYERAHLLGQDFKVRWHERGDGERAK